MVTMGGRGWNSTVVLAEERGVLGRGGRHLGSLLGRLGGGSLGLGDLVAELGGDERRGVAVDERSMVARMPLLISLRMTSAGFTSRSSASSMIVGGSVTAPRSRGSATETGEKSSASLRCCGCGVRGSCWLWPSGPLGLGDESSVVLGAGGGPKPGRDRTESREEPAAPRRAGTRIGAHVRAAPGRLAERVDGDLPGRASHYCRSSRFCRAVCMPTQVRVGNRRGGGPPVAPRATTPPPSGRSRRRPPARPRRSRGAGLWAWRVVTSTASRLSFAARSTAALDRQGEEPPGTATFATRFSSSIVAPSTWAGERALATKTVVVGPP